MISPDSSTCDIGDIEVSAEGSWSGRLFTRFSREQLNNLARAWRVLIFIVNYIITPWGIFAPALECQDDYRRSDQWRAVFRGVIIVLAIIALCLTFLGDLLPKYFSIAFLVLGLVANVFLCPFLYIVYDDNRRTDAILSQTRQLHKNTSTLVGDRLWAETKTNTLLTEIILKAHDERAKWHLVKFLANLADEHISFNQDHTNFCLTTKTDGVWHVAKYSNFLHDNIDHAEHEILWLVDPVDFRNVLLPDCLHYVLASIALSVLGEPRDTWQSQENYGTVFSPMLDKADKRLKQSMLKHLRCKEHEEICLINPGPTGKEYVWWDHFSTCVLGTLSHFGHLLIEAKQDHLDHSVVEEGFDKLYNKWLKYAFPHVAAFRRSKVQQCLRILYIPRIKRSTDTDPGSRDEVGDDLAVRMYSGTVRDELERRKYLSIYGELCPRMVDEALGLFASLSGGDEHIKVFLGIPTVPSPSVSSLDVGLYDRHFAVWSSKDTQGNDRTENASTEMHRIIRWYYLQKPTEWKALPEDFAFGLRILMGNRLPPADQVAREMAPDKTRTGFAKFKEGLVTCIRESIGGHANEDSAASGGAHPVPNPQS